MTKNNAFNNFYLLKIGYLRITCDIRNFIFTRLDFFTRYLIDTDLTQIKLFRKYSLLTLELKNK